MFERARLRLALFYAGAFAVILLVLGVSAYWIMARELDDEIDQSLERGLDQVASLPARDLVSGGLPTRGPGGPEHPADAEQTISSDVFFLVVGSEGTVLNNPRSLDPTALPIAELQAKTAANDGAVSEDLSAGGEHIRVIAEDVPLVDGPGTVIVRGQQVDVTSPLVTVIVGRSLEARDYQLRLLATVLGLGGLAGLALATAGGFWLAGRALVPIRTSLETQRHFVSDASHELRTPLAVVKANAEVLLRHPGQTVEENIDQVAAINEESDHLARLVGDMLTLARADEQRLEIAREPLPLDALLESVARDMDAVATAKGVALTTELAPGTIDADPQRLRQLVAILLDNALKFTPPGGGVSLSSRRSGSRWTITVSDTGPGISPEAQKRVFDRFYRTDESRGTPGTGLGLSIAKSIAEAHDGRISVASTPGQGATFTVSLGGGAKRAEGGARAEGSDHAGPGPVSGT